MARPTSKDSLVEATELGYVKLNDLIAKMTNEEVVANFAFEDRDRNCRDVLAHLVEWQNMLLQWEAANRKGEDKTFLPSPHTWKTTATLNQELWEKNQSLSLEEVQQKLQQSHDATLALIDSYTDDELFTKKYFPWTGTTSLGSYCVSATSSHYDWAMKKLRKHIKTVNKK